MADKEKSVYELDLHESLTFKNTLGGNVEVTKVPGGWVYAFDFPAFRQSPTVFVPSPVPAGAIIKNHSEIV